MVGVIVGKRLMGHGIDMDAGVCMCSEGGRARDKGGRITPFTISVSEWTWSDNKNDVAVKL